MKVTVASAAGDRPHDRLQAADRHAEQQGPVLVLGRGPHRPAGVGAQQEPAEAAEDDRRDAEHQEVVAADRVRAGRRSCR